jgi:hypothetical protein
MNTPRTQKRGHRLERTLDRPSIEIDEFLATYSSTLDKSYLTALGEVVLAWPHVEYALNSLFAHLMGDVSIECAEEVFGALPNNRARLEILKRLLERTEDNRDKPASLDEFLTEFERLNRIRNGFIHAFWWQNKRTGEAICTLQRDNQLGPLDGRTVPVAEIENFVVACKSFSDTVFGEFP